MAWITKIMANCCLDIVIDYIIINSHESFQNNTFIEKLNLHGNSVEGEGAGYIAKSLKENLYISELVSN